MAGNSKVVVLWVAGGIGIVLLYSAYKGKSPTSIITEAFASTKKPAAEKTLSATTAGKGTKTPQTGEQVAEINDPGANHNVAATRSLASGNVVRMEDGTYWVTDIDGNPIEQVAGAYATSPHTYIPTGVN